MLEASPKGAKMAVMFAVGAAIRAMFAGVVATGVDEDVAAVVG